MAQVHQKQVQLPSLWPRGRSEIIVGDGRTALSRFPDGYFRCCVTSPPYWGLRDYGVGSRPQAGVARSVQHRRPHIACRWLARGFDR
jgi:DNA modification methylase